MSQELFSIRLAMKLLGVILCALALSACASGFRNDVRDDFAIWQRHHDSGSGGSSTVRSGSQVDVAVIATPSLLMPFALTPGFTPMVGVESPETVTPSFANGILFVGAGDALRDLLSYRLHEAGVTAAVRLQPTVTPGTDTAVSVQAGLNLLPQHRAVITLVATLPGGRTLTGTGRSDTTNTAVHFAWALPALLITGFTGLIFIGPTMRSINIGADEANFIEASDRACTDLAQQIAAASNTQAHASN